jgi:hypothetical protein
MEFRASTVGVNANKPSVLAKPLAPISLPPAAETGIPRLAATRRAVCPRYAVTSRTDRRASSCIAASAVSGAPLSKGGSGALLRGDLFRIQKTNLRQMVQKQLAEAGFGIARNHRRDFSQCRTASESMKSTPARYGQKSASACAKLCREPNQNCPPA